MRPLGEGALGPGLAGAQATADAAQAAEGGGGGGQQADAAAEDVAEVLQGRYMSEYFFFSWIKIICKDSRFCNISNSNNSNYKSSRKGKNNSRLYMEKIQKKRAASSI